jgi:hypothetical protein
MRVTTLTSRWWEPSTLEATLTSSDLAGHVAVVPNMFIIRDIDQTKVLFLDANKTPQLFHTLTR